MTLLAQRQTIRKHIRNLDEAAYSDNGGAPSHAGMGVQIFKNDRVLAANCRRGFSQSFPQDNLPTVGAVSGMNFGPWDFYGTPGVTQGEFYFVANIDSGKDVSVTTYRIGAFDEYTGIPNDSTENTITGTGSAKLYGPYTVSLKPGSQQVGFVLCSSVDSGSGLVTGEISNWIHHKKFQSASGTDLSSYIGDAISFNDVAAGADPQTIWFDIVFTEDSGIVPDTNDGSGVAYTDDVCSINPSLRSTARANAAIPYRFYEIQSISQAEVHCITFRELPSSGEFTTDGEGNDGYSYQPIPDNMAFAKTNFMTTPWNTMAHNNLHLNSTRGRIVACERFMDVEATTSLSEVGRFYFDSTPGETLYFAKLIFWSRSARASIVGAYTRFTLSDYAGANSSQAIFDISDTTRNKADPLVDTIPFYWPFSGLDIYTEGYSESWVPIVASSALGTDGRLITVEVEKQLFGGRFDDVPELYIRGITIVGLSRT